MAEPFLAEIRVMSFHFPPKGWAFCDGQSLPIGQNPALYALLGTIYGGDGRTTFALPDLRGRVPIHAGAGHTLGDRGGVREHALTVPELPAHSHPLRASAAPANASPPSPSGNLLADSTPARAYTPPSGGSPMRSGTIAEAGGSEPHQNMQPFLTLSFCIALQGAFPSNA